MAFFLLFRLLSLKVPETAGINFVGNVVTEIARGTSAAQERTEGGAPIVACRATKSAKALSRQAKPSKYGPSLRANGVFWFVLQPTTFLEKMSVMELEKNMKFFKKFLKSSEWAHSRRRCTQRVKRCLSIMVSFFSGAFQEFPFLDHFGFFFVFFVYFP